VKVYLDTNCIIYLLRRVLDGRREVGPLQGNHRGGAGVIPVPDDGPLATAPTSTKEGWWPYLQRVRAEREAAGYRFMDEAEMEGHLLWLRDDEERIDRIHREMDEERRRQEEP
jgi:hypothetical protein